MTAMRPATLADVPRLTTIAATDHARDVEPIGRRMQDGFDRVFVRKTLGR